MHKRHRSTIAALAAIPLMLAALAACADADPPASEGSSAGQESSSAVSREDYQLAFAGCMREHGIDMPDPDADGSIAIDVGGDVDAFNTATEACIAELGSPPAPEGGGGSVSDEERIAEYLAIAECFREHGVEVRDPEPDGGLDIPDDAPMDVFEQCAPEGISGPAGGGQ